MNISILWHEPLKLIDGSDENLIYTVNGLDKVEGISGVYIFCRAYGKNLVPLYIGKAKDLASRIRHQLNTTKLMNAIKKSPIGARVLVVGEFQGRPGQTPDTCIKLVEKVLIEHAMAEGYELINQQGTKTPYHEIVFTGNASVKELTGRRFLLKK